MKYENFKRGRSFEEEFKEIALFRGLTVEQSSLEVDRKKHIDFFITNKEQKTFSFDVKAMRSLDGGKTTQDIFTAVEFQNVKGEKGWLYGEADYIAFERKQDIFIIKRTDLASFSEDKVQFRTSDRFADSLYKLYSRKSKKDLISLIRLSDIPRHKMITWPKTPQSPTL